MMKNRSIAIVASVFFATSASAEARTPSLAAAGDCAQPLADVAAPPPPYGEPASVTGPASDHFAPQDRTALGALPLGSDGAVRGVVAESTNVVEGTAGVVEGTVDAAGDAAGGVVDGTTDTVDDAAGAIDGAVGDTTGAIDDAAGAIGGAVGDTTDAIGDAAGALDSGLGGGTDLGGAIDDAGSLTGDATGAIGDTTGALDSVTEGALDGVSGEVGSLGDAVDDTLSGLGGL